MSTDPLTRRLRAGMTAPPADTIRLVQESPDDAMYSVGLAADAEVGDETFALIFSEGSPDDGDGYCVVAEPGQRTHYRALESCELNRSLLRLVFTSHAAAALDLPRELVLELDVSESDIAALEGGLRRVGAPVSSRPA